jgi:hypothetical protein
MEGDFFLFFLLGDGAGARRGSKTDIKKSFCGVKMPERGQKRKNIPDDPVEKIKIEC